MSNKGEQYGPGWAYIALMVHENGEIHAVGGDRRGDDPDADLPYIGLERLDTMLGQRQSVFSCAKRAADPQNESAACHQWCGDSQRCVTSFDTAKFFRHVDAILSMGMEQREQSTFGAREATPELMAAIRAVNEIEEKTRRPMFGALSEHKQITNAPEVSSEHIQALAKMCGLIPSQTTTEWVSTLVRFVRVVLDNNSVQEAFVRANAGLLAAAPQPSPEPEKADEDVCPECQGKGSMDVTHEPLRDGYTETFGQCCDLCQGTGKVAVPAQSTIRPVTPLTCPKCNALWLFWPKEQSGFEQDTLNMRADKSCDFCEHASADQLESLNRVTPKEPR